MADDEVPYRVLSPRTIWLAAVVIAVVGIGVAVWLLLAYGDGDPKSANQLDAIKAAGTIVVGTGGAAALLLAARRQRTAEIALRQKDRDLRQKEEDQAAVARDFQLRERMAADARMDAIERRITELYTKAADQLGSDKPAVRLAGLYALERLAQSQPEQRQTIVNLLCAYLRMPAPEGAAEEQEVRQAAQRILTNHLRELPSGAPEPAEEFSGRRWHDIDIDLTAAVLNNFDFSFCTVRSAIFTKARFTGSAWFTGVTFTAFANFREAMFNGIARFSTARFLVLAQFDDAQFAANAEFDDTRMEDAHFRRARFAGRADFDRTRFGMGAEFPDVHFFKDASFADAELAGGAWFGRAQFDGGVTFLGAVAEGRQIGFRRARFGDVAAFDGVRFGSAGFDNTEFDGLATFASSRIDNASFREAQFAADADFGGAVIDHLADFTAASFGGPAQFHAARLPSGRTLFSGVSFTRGVPDEVAKYWSGPEPSTSPPGTSRA